MKRSLWFTLFVAAFLITGCAKKSVEIEAPQGNASNQEQATEVNEGSGIKSVGEMSEESMGPRGETSTDEDDRIPGQKDLLRF